MNPFSCELALVATPARLTLGGEIDIQAVDEVRAAMDQAREQHVRRLDVDLTGVDFIDSSGLGLIAQAAADLEDLRVVAAPISVIRVLEMTGLGDLVQIEG